MRSERNIGKSILVHFDGQNNAFFIRKKGKDNKYNYDELLIKRLSQEGLFLFVRIFPYNNNRIFY